jgi:HK97 gp10 family phage protein
MGKGYSIDEFRRRLARVPKAVRREVNTALEKNADEWVKMARRMAPKDPKDGTPLHDSIRHYQSDTGGQIVRAGGETTTKPSAGGPYDYAIGQEFGTQDMPASPFFWPSYRLLKKRFNSRRKRALNKAFKDFNNG